MTSEPTNENLNDCVGFFPGDMPEGLDLVVADLGCARHHILGYRLGYQQVWPPATLPTVPLATEALDAGRVGTTLVATPNVSTDPRVLAELNTIKGMMSTACPPKNAKRQGGGGGKTHKVTVDQRLEELHKASPEIVDESTLKKLGKILNCAPSAFIGGTYYETVVKMKMREFKAKRALKRAAGPDRDRLENEQVNRDMREHVDSQEDHDAYIDATWGTRKSGHSAGE